MRRVAAVLGLFVFGGAAAATGCGGGIGPGDYVVYSVAFGNTKFGSDCDLSPDQEDDASTVRSTATLVLYGGPKEKEVLAELTFPGAAGQTVTLDGTAKDKKHTFTGKTTDVNHRMTFGARPTDVTVTKVVTYSLELTLDGDRVTGTAKLESSCNGTPNNTTETENLLQNECNHDGDFPYECTVTFSLDGSRVRDVELKHEV